MSSKIRILPEDLCNKIAAGEVIERPASVVKELVENSLDAEASEIAVEIEMGGRRLIRVTDDGWGMGRDDILLCLERHATSKIKSAADLFGPHTLGFRGEALPSIAAVSRMTLRSRSSEDEEGWLIYAEGGRIRKAEACGLPHGTVMEVRDLFFNTPARKKFLRRETTELGHIGDVLGRLALAYPHVQFRLRHQGRSLLDLYRHENILERAGAFFGSALARDLIPFRRETEAGMVLSGLIAQPAVHRPSSQGIYTYVNQRFVRDRVIQHALREGYRQLVPQGRFPVAVLFLEIDARRVDVNVHPTKHEVRFSEQGEIHDFIAAAIRDALRPSGWLRQPVAGGRSGENDAGPASPDGASSTVKPEVDAGRRVAESLGRYAAGLSPVRGFPEPGAFRPPARQPELQSSAAEPPAGFFTSMQIIGQFSGSYILAQNGEDLVVIDQHAAHERIGFEKLRQQFRKGSVESQQLLFPVVVDLELAAAALLTDHLEELRRLGFEIEPFGGPSFAVKAVPAILQGAEIRQLVGDVADDLEALDKSSSIETQIDRVLVRMACHGVIRAGQKLSAAEMGALMRELDLVDFQAHCPHGRPVMHRWHQAELEKFFKRS